MEQKKTTKANLEDKRNLFFLFGLVLSLGTILFAFEWTSSPSQATSLGTIESVTIEEEIIPITREQDVKPPPPPPPLKVVEILNIVDDNVEIEDELDIADTEADNETIIDVQPVIASEEEDVEHIFLFAEDPPEFPGGDKALYSYISKTVRYPVIAQENGIQGRVYVKFVVNEKGKVSNCEILRGVDPSLNNEALRVINSLPDFKPGKQRGRPVKVYYNSMINFTLQ